MVSASTPSRIRAILDFRRLTSGRLASPDPALLRSGEKARSTRTGIVARNLGLVADLRIVRPGSPLDLLKIDMLLSRGDPLDSGIRGIARVLARDLKVSGRHTKKHNSNNS